MLPRILPSPKALLTTEELATISEAVKEAESATSGEIRIFIESRCAYMNPSFRAQEIFMNLGMHQTVDRNAVLIYIAFKDHDFALIGDKAIYEVATKPFWETTAKELAKRFYNKEYVSGICDCVASIGSKLHSHFPTHGETKNELPDEIVFGK